MLFAIYSLAAAIYRWVVVFSILWFLQRMLEPYQLKSIGQIIAAASMSGLFVQPLWKLVKFFYVPGRTDQVKKVRSVRHDRRGRPVVAALFLLPLPHREYCMLQIQPHEAVSVRVIVPGRIEEILVEPGQHVEAGQLLIAHEQSRPGIDDRRSRRPAGGRPGQVRRAELQQFRNDTAALQLSSVHENILATEEALRLKRADLAKLKLVAPIAGTVLPPPEQPYKPADPDGQLPSWYGTPLEDRNVGSFLSEALWCAWSGSQQMQADLVLDQSQIDFIATGQNVNIKLDHLPLDEFQGKITTIALQDMKVTPKNLSNKSGGELASKTDESGVERPWSPSYQALVFPLTGPDDLLRSGLRGARRFTPAGNSRRARLRLLGNTFNFRL